MYACLTVVLKVGFGREDLDHILTGEVSRGVRRR